MEQGIRLNIKLSRDAYRNFTGEEISEDFGFMPKEDFERKYAEFQESRFNIGAIETAVGIARRFNRKELQEFIKQLEEENKCARTISLVLE